MEKVRNMLFVGVSHFLREQKDCLLDRRDFRLHSAETAEEALRLHRETHMDLIVADLDVPVMGGDGLCSAIREEPDLRRVYVSLVCSGKKADLVRCGKCGADSFVRRPAEMRKITEKICRILNIIERRDKRVLLKCAVQGSYLDEPFFSTSQDLSRSGILFETDRTLAKGDRVSFSFILPDQSKVLGRGRVMRVTQAEQGGYRYGVEFVELEAGSAENIEQYVETTGQPIRGEEIY